MVRAVNREAGVDVEQSRRSGGSLAAGDFAAWRDRAGIFESLAVIHLETRGHLGGAVRLTHADADPNAEPATVAFVSEDFFKTVGVWPAAGRAFREPGDVVLPERYWSSRFNIRSRDHRPACLARVRRRRVEQSAYRGRCDAGGLRGVLARHRFPAIPRHRGRRQTRRESPKLCRRDRKAAAGDVHRAGPVESRRLLSGPRARQPRRNRRWQMRLVPVTEDSAGAFRPFMTALVGAVAFMLLILCTNVATLLLGKTATRGKEIAVRVALGASRGRVVWHLVTESLVLAVAGAITGLGLAYGGRHVAESLVAKSAYLGRGLSSGRRSANRRMGRGIRGARCAAGRRAVRTDPCRACLEPEVGRGAQGRHARHDGHRPRPPHLGMS